MQRRIPIYALLLSSVSAIIGSGWLFAAFYSAKLAGPASLISWLIGGAMMIAIAFVFAELSAMLPISGSSTRVPQFTHGTLTSFIFSWAIWLAYVAVPPTEVQAVLQYSSYFFPGLVHNADGSLAKEGYFAATFLMLLITTINIFSLRWLLNFNSGLTILKIAIPLLVGGVILANFFSVHAVIHPANSAFMPMGWHGVLAAISTGGIVFAFNGFKQACELAGEAKRPSLALPIAVIGSVSICLIIYATLQLGFLSSLNLSNLANGWQNLDLQGANSPLAATVLADHLKFLMPLLYIGAIVAPMAAALMYVSSAGRSLYGMSKNKQLPAMFATLNAEGNPVFAIAVNFALGMMMFAPLPGWNSMVSFLVSIFAVNYAVGPINLMALRLQAPNYSRPFKLPFANLWSVICFYFCTLLIYWCGWDIMFKLVFCIFIGLVVLLIHRVFITTEERTPLNWRESIWLWFYFAAVFVISYCGNFGGHNLLPAGWDWILLALACAVSVYLALRFKLSSAQTYEYLDNL